MALRPSTQITHQGEYYLTMDCHGRHVMALISVTVNPENEAEVAV